MFISQLLRVRFVAAVALALVLATAAYGFAAANAVDPSSAGSGEGAISGYVTKSIAYTMDAANPNEISSVTFDLFEEDGSTAANPTDVHVQFLDSGGAVLANGLYDNCSAGSSPAWTCSTTGTKVTADVVEELRVIAHD